jgi:hypothetical protein
VINVLLKTYLVVVDLDECSSSPCENGGTCTGMVGDFFCECPIEYKGKNCSIGKLSRICGVHKFY